MKVYFSTSGDKKNIYSKYFTKIYSTIEELGYVHLNKTANETNNNLGKNGEKESINLYNLTISSLKTADINVFECSSSSLSIGYKIGKSLEFNKPTVVLYYNNNLPHFLIGEKDEKLIIKKYNEKNLKTVIKDALNEAREKSDKRFNFFISPRLLNYLEQASKHEGITKSTFIRNLILDHMRKQSS